MHATYLTHLIVNDYINPSFIPPYGLQMLPNASFQTPRICPSECDRRLQAVEAISWVLITKTVFIAF